MQQQQHQLHHHQRNENLNEEKKSNFDKDAPTRAATAVLAIRDEKREKKLSIYFMFFDFDRFARTNK